MPANPNVVNIVVTAGLGEAQPRATNVPIPPEYNRLLLSVSLNGFGAGRLGTALAGFVSWAAPAAGAFETLSIGGGHMSCPLCKTMLPRTTSSSKLMWKWSFSPIDSRNFDTLFPYSVELWVGRRLGKSVNPMCTTSWIVRISPGTVVSTLPPVSAAKSTVNKNWSIKFRPIYFQK